MNLRLQDNFISPGVFMYRLKLTIFTALILTLSLQSDVIQSETIAIIKEHCFKHDATQNIDAQKADNKNTFIVFDIDHTIGLWVMKKSLMPWFTHVFYPSWNSILDRLQHTVKLHPMEDCTVPLIQQLQQEGFTVLVLTARAPYVAPSTFDHLHGLTLDFSASLSPMEDHIIKGPELNKSAMYKNGVIFCHQQDKGVVLAQFLHQNNLNPECLIFADDLLENAKAVDNAMKKAKIKKRIAVHYTRKKTFNHYTHFRDSLKVLFGA